MVYLSGTRANNVGDEAEEYYEDEFEHLVYDMRHADDDWCAEKEGECRAP